MRRCHSSSSSSSHSHMSTHSMTLGARRGGCITEVWSVKGSYTTTDHASACVGLCMCVLERESVSVFVCKCQQKKKKIAQDCRAAALTRCANGFNLRAPHGHLTQAHTQIHTLKQKNKNAIRIKSVCCRCFFVFFIGIYSVENSTN